MELLAHLNYDLILASKSPRRQQLLHGLGLSFEVRTKDVDEDFPTHLRAAEIPLYLCEMKADAFIPGMKDHEMLITADTVVWVNDHVLNKPADEQEAFSMIRELSGQRHTVYTGVCLTTTTHRKSFTDATDVFFHPLSDEEIWHYIRGYHPFDKAGSYGAQDFIGYIGIERIEGSYFNVMGLPVHKVYQALKTWPSRDV